MSKFNDSIGQQRVSPLLQVPELMAEYRMNEIITKSKEATLSIDHLITDISHVELLGLPSSRMMASLPDKQKALVEFRLYDVSADQSRRTDAEKTTERLATI